MLMMNWYVTDKIASDVHNFLKFGRWLDDDQVKKIARTASAVLAPLASIFGGIVGQEVAKAVSQFSFAGCPVS